jgi:predicted transcriptional regulator
MRLSRIRDLLACEVLHAPAGPWFDREVPLCLCADLMSDVLAFAHPAALVITGLANHQSVRTASFADASAILFVRGKRPDDRSLDVAVEVGLPVLVTSHSMFDACGILFDAGLRGAC